MVSIENLHKRFNPGTIHEVYALRGIDLSIAKGEFVTVIGTNGSGKSTLLNAIAGSFKPDQGRIIINGKDITNTAEHFRARQISHVFQDPYKGTAPEMTVGENLQAAYLRGQRHLARIGLNAGQMAMFRKELADMEMGLHERLDSMIGRLSGGQRQAISLLMSVIRKPDLLLLDEHTAALDPKSAAQVVNLTRHFIEENELTAIMITHSMQQALNLGNRIIMMHKGKVIDAIGGEEKKRITEKDLLNKFEKIKKQERLNEEMIRSFEHSYR